MKLLFIFLLFSSVAFGQTRGYILERADGTVTLPNGSVSNVQLQNSSVTINGSPVSLGGSINVSGGSGPTFLNLANAFSSTSTTPAAVTGWSFAVTSGVTYRIEVIGDYQTAATTTGGIIGISLTGATGSVRGFAKGSVSASAAATEISIPIRATSGAGSTLTTSGVSAINTPHFVHLLITFTCTGNGTFNIVWGSEINASASQLNQNSTLTYQALN